LLLPLLFARTNNKEGAPCLPVLETWDRNIPKFSPRILHRITTKYATLKMDREKARFPPEPGLFIPPTHKKGKKKRTHFLTQFSPHKAKRICNLQAKFSKCVFGGGNQFQQLKLSISKQAKINLK
jgi:hypothetical protein